MFGAIVGFQQLYGDSFLEISLKDENMGIKAIQKSTPKWIRKYLQVQTALGGGLEIQTFMFFILIF